MIKTPLIAALFASIVSFAAASYAAAEEITPIPLSREDAISKSRGLASGLVRQNQAALKTLLKEGGSLKALGACSKISADIISSLTEKNGYYLKRTSLKTRNPENDPDPYEEDALNEFEALKMEGKLKEGFDDWKVVTEDGERYLRYMRPLIVKSACLPCHGQKEDMAADVKDFLSANYPADRATGFHSGDVRGAVSVKIPLKPLEK